MRSGASVDHERAFSSVPRGARIAERSPHSDSTSASSDPATVTGRASLRTLRLAASARNRVRNRTKLHRHATTKKSAAINGGLPKRSTR